MKQSQLIDLYQQKFVNAVATIVVKQAQKANQPKTEKHPSPKKIS